MTIEVTIGNRTFVLTRQEAVDLSAQLTRALLQHLTDNTGMSRAAKLAIELALEDGERDLAAMLDNGEWTVPT